MAREARTVVPQVVSDNERECFAENGWVSLPQLIGESDTAIVRECLRQKRGVDALHLHAG
jgi:hypothetical protein